MKNKLIILICIFCFVLGIQAFADTAYQKITSTPIAHGVTLNKVSQFTSNGWVNLDIIEIDLTNSKTNVGPLFSSAGTSHFSTIKTMANESGAIAGINADYFARRPNTTNRGQSIGFLGKNSKILTSSAEENISDNVMASVILNKDESIIYTYLSNKIIVKAKNGETFEADGINKYVPYNKLCIFTSTWGDKTIGNSEGNWLVEAVVIDGKVTEIRENMEGTEIPENGYVISAFGQIPIDYILNNISVGDEISYDIDINMDLSNMAFAISGGTMLVREGVATNFSHIVYGTNEMSAVGTSKDNKTMYLIACKNVDGKNNGISQRAFANAIADYGIYTALCLDGGGSTTMVAKKLGEDNISIINSRSTSYLRPVVNGIGVFSETEKTNTPLDMNIYLDNDHIFKENTAKLSFLVYDTNYNKMDVSLEDLKVTLSNNNATYSNGIITGKKEGTCTLTIKYKNVTKKIDIEVLGDIYSLSITPNNVAILPNESYTFSLIATDKNGYSSKISNELVNWYIDGYGNISNGTFTSKKIGATIVSASINGATAYALINVNEEKEKVLDNFEELKGAYSGYPNDLEGDVSTYSKKTKEGKYSLKLEYNFNYEEQRIRGSYYDYSTPLQLPDYVQEIGIWVYAPSNSTNSIKSQYLNEYGNTRIDILAEEIDWTGWKYITYPSYSKVKSIVSIYVAEDEEETLNEGYVLFDELTVKYLGNEDNVALPSNISKQDLYNKKPNNTNYTLSIIESLPTPETLLDRIINNKVINTFNESSTSIVFTKSNSSVDYLNKLDSKYMVANKYTEELIGNTYIVTIPCHNGGIRKTDFESWKSLIKLLENNKNNSILIILNNSLNNFSDEEEKNLLLELLSNEISEKDVSAYIIEQGNSTKAITQKGIKILTIGNSSLKGIEKKIDEYKYINIYLTVSDIYYEINNIF